MVFSRIGGGEIEQAQPLLNGQAPDVDGELVCPVRNKVVVHIAAVAILRGKSELVEIIAAQLKLRDVQEPGGWQDVDCFALVDRN